MRLAPILRIARWETTRELGGIDRGTAIGFLIIAIVLIGVAPFLITQGASGDAGLYRVAGEDDNQYSSVVVAASQLRLVSPDRRLGHGADLRLRDGGIEAADTAKGQAALAAMREAIASYNDALLANAADQNAAFPVRVRLRYATQIAVGTSDGDTQADRTTVDPDPGPGSGGDDGETGGDTGDGSGFGATLQGIGQALLGGSQSGTPGTISPPVPVRSLVLAFVFVVPLNVIIQAFGSGIMTERVNRRGEPLLVTPVSRYEVVAGKTLPYLCAAIAVTVAIAVVVGGSILSVVAVIPLALLFLSATFLSAMFARSYRELSFLTVAVSVSLTAYAFVPAIFTEIAPVAAISPLSIVVYDLAGTPVGVTTVAFATVPALLVSLVFFALGVGLFREEDLFGHHRVPAKVLDAFAAQLAGPGRIGLWSGILVPFVFVAELLAIAVLFAVQAPITIPVLLAVVAIIEETAKSIHVRAGFTRGKLRDTDRTAVVAGILSGVGFWVAEKLVLVVQVVGLGDLALAQAAFAPVGVTDPIVLLGLLMVPLGMHVLTAVVSAIGARRSRGRFLLLWWVAVVVHFAYDLVVVSVLG